MLGNTCQFKTKSKRVLTAHIRAQHDDETEHIKCDQCEFKAKNNRGLKIHISVMHENRDEKIYQCEKCEFKTKSKGGIKIHEKAKHPEAHVIPGHEKLKIKDKMKHKDKKVIPKLTSLSKVSELEKNTNQIKIKSLQRIVSEPDIKENKMLWLQPERA